GSFQSFFALYFSAFRASHAVSRKALRYNSTSQGESQHLFAPSERFWNPILLFVATHPGVRKMWIKI
ncbi:MAG: hypothetical protein IIY16_06720, partial [Oscillospiraceae bacterium]|nr:hypothetical protein [Oscillospiraceae bacterium]